MKPSSAESPPAEALHPQRIFTPARITAGVFLLLSILFAQDTIARVVFRSYGGMRRLPRSAYIKPRYVYGGYLYPGYTIRQHTPDNTWELDSFGGSSFSSTSPSWNSSPSLGNIPKTDPNTAVMKKARELAAADPKTAFLFEGSQPAREQAASNAFVDALTNLTVPALKENAEASQILEDRNRERTRWADTARQAMVGRTSIIFSPAWWQTRQAQFNQPWFYRQPIDPNPALWWSHPTWPTINNALGLENAPPFVYDYDFTIYYQTAVVYADAKPVSAYEIYLDLVSPFANKNEPASAEPPAWHPLGTWAISTDPDQAEPNMLMQLAMSRTGFIAGAYYNTTSDNTQLITGSIDFETQRTAFRIGSMKSAILEVGLDSFTRPQAPLWAHFTDGRIQTWLLARLDPPDP
ncbi:MAG: hypothetical protein AAGD22_05090 [Verrucomicrobiota bacterium]